MLRPSHISLLFACLSLSAAMAGSHILGDLDSAQVKEIEAGKQVVLFEEVPGVPWPRTSVYQVVDTSAEEVMAVFFDYQSAKSFMPHLLKSEVSKAVTPCILEVDYGLDVPILPDEFYTARNALSALPGGAYKVDWKLLRAVQTKDAVGSLIIEPLGNKAVLRYKNLTVPSSGMAVILKGPAIERMKATVNAICKEAVRLKTKDPRALEEKVEAMRKAIAGG